MIYNDFEKIEIPAELKTSKDFAEIREKSKRVGKIVREAVFDGVDVKSVTVTDFSKKRKAVFLHGNHLGITYRTGPHSIQQFSHSRHIAILHGHPDRRLVAIRQLSNCSAILRCCTQRFFGQNRAGIIGQNFFEDLNMGMVG